MINVLSRLEDMSASELEEEFCLEEGTSMWLVWFMRLLTSAYLKVSEPIVVVPQLSDVRIYLTGGSVILQCLQHLCGAHLES